MGRLVASKTIPDPDKSVEADMWKPRFLGFVKKHAVERAQSMFKAFEGVAFAALEDCIFGYNDKAALP